VVTALLSREQSRRVLIFLLVPAVGVGIGELGVAGLFVVAVVTDGEVCSRAEGRPEVDGVEDGAFFVNETHLLLEREGK
jgi:hypothetical protein